MFSQRRGFTLIELLVVIAIIAVLMALLLPAVQKVREAANKMRCANNLKQFGVALHMYSEYNRRLPPGGRVRLRGDGSDDWNQDQGSWNLQLLPFMEQQTLYKLFASQLKADGDDPCPRPNGTTGPCSVKRVTTSRGFETDYWEVPPPPYSCCPSDRWNHDEWPSTNYGASQGPQCTGSPCGFAPYRRLCEGTVRGVPESPEYGHTFKSSEVRGCFNRLGARIRLPEDIRDGTSTTILLGEVRPAEHDHLSRWGRWMNMEGGGAEVTTLPPINYRTNDEKCCDTGLCYDGSSGGDPARSIQNWNLSWGFKSKHPGGANFVFADGSVHFLTQNIAHESIFQWLGARNDEQTIGVIE